MEAGGEKHFIPNYFWTFTDSLLPDQRGKWRPSLQKYIESNPEDLVLSTTRKGFLESNSPEIAIKSLCVMKGVGPATASAILSVFQYKTEPFFSDEAVEIILKLKADYTVKMLNSYRIGMQQRVKEDEFANVEELERACWAFCVQQRFGDKIEKVVKKRKKAENEEEEEEAVKSKPKLKKEKV